VASWIADAGEHPQADGASLRRLKRAFARELRRIGSPDRFEETGPFLRLRGDSLPGDRALDGTDVELRAGPTLSFQAHARDTDLRLGDSTRAGLYGVVLFRKTAALQGELFIGEIEDGRRIGDPLIKGTDILYFAEEIGAIASTGNFHLRLARGRHHWGHGSGPALLLDRSAAPLNSLEWGLGLPGGIRFRSWVGTLNWFEERGIAAHRLELPLGSDLRIAISEGVRFHGRLDHPLYLLGLMPYTLVQRFDEQDTAIDSLRMLQRNNILAMIDLIWRPRPGALAYTEILVDDIPAETADAPARIGGRLGLALLPIVSGVPLEVRLEGTKIGRYTYAVEYGGGCECDWIHQDRALGDPSGPDQEAIRLWVGRSLGRDHHLELFMLYANRGGGTLGEAWIGQESDLSGLTRRALTVSPPVTRTRRISLSWDWTPRDNLRFELVGGGTFSRSGEARPGNRWRGHFDLSSRLSWRL
jgi:hypothetical protein